MTIELTTKTVLKTVLLIALVLGGRAEAKKVIHHAQARFAAAQNYNK